jgi:ATP synthase protein I
MATIETTAEEQGQEKDFRPWTAEQAQEFREMNPQISPWRVVVGQLLVGLLLAAVVGVVTGRLSLAVSVGYGVIAVVLPAVVFVRGLLRGVSSVGAVGKVVGAAVFGFLLWELVKIAMTVVMLIAAPKLVVNLSWPAMLMGMVVTMKVYWVALVFGRAFKAKDKA